MKKTWIAALLLAVWFINLLPAGALVAGEAPRVAQLTIAYQLEDNSHHFLADPYTATLAVGSAYSVPSPAPSGYALLDEAQATVEGVLDKDTTVAVQYRHSTPDAAYTIRYVDGADGRLLKEMTGEASVGSVVTAPYETFEGYYLSEKTALSVEIAEAAEKNVITVPYSAFGESHIYFDTGEGGSYVPMRHGKPGSAVPEDPLPVPTRPGYVFDGWNRPLPQVFPTGSLTITACWQPADATYTVMVLLQDSNDPSQYHKMSEEDVARTNDLLATIDRDLYADELAALGLSEVPLYFESERKALTGTALAPSALDEALANDQLDFMMEDRSPFYPYYFSHYDEAVVQADGTAVLYLYFDCHDYEVVVHGNLTPAYEFDEDWNLIYPTADNEDVLMRAKGRYQTETPPALSDAEALSRMMEGAYPEHGRFIGLTDITGYETFKATGHLQLYPTRLFGQESELGTRAFHVFPIFSDEAYPLYVKLYEERLDGSGYEEAGQVNVAYFLPLEDENSEFTQYPSPGFSWIGGAYQTGTSWEDALSSEKKTFTAPDAVIRDDGKLAVNDLETCVALYMQRAHYSVTYASLAPGEAEAQVLGRETDIPFGAAHTLWTADVLPAQAIPEGMRFAGWYASPTLFDIEAPQTALTMPAQDVVLYAKWLPVDRSVTFDAAGGAPTPEAQAVVSGTAAKAPEAPTKEGAVFEGWYTRAGHEWEFAHPVTEDLQLTARWHDQAEAAYEIRHMMAGAETPFYVEQGMGHDGSTVMAAPLEPWNTAYPLDHFVTADGGPQTLTLHQGEMTTLTYVYQEAPAEKTYEVQYLDRESGKALQEAKTVTTTVDRVTEFAPEIIGYVPQETAQTLTLSTESAVRFTFYYTRDGGGTPPAAAYVVDVVAGSGGHVTPNGRVTVTAGANQAFVIQPDAGHYLHTVRLDGALINAEKTVTLENIHANHILEVTFAPLPLPPDESGVAEWLETAQHTRYLHGYPDGIFEPEAAMRRAEVAGMFHNLLLDKGEEAPAVFRDVEAGAWYEAAVNTLAAKGLAAGVGDGRFEPNRAVTRAEFAAMAMRFSKTEAVSGVSFSDVPPDAWYAEAVAAAVQNGWLFGYDDGTFHPNAEITRAEVTAIVNRMLYRLGDSSYLAAHPDVLQQFADVSADHWAYVDIMEATNSHRYETDDSGEDWTRLLN